MIDFITKFYIMQQDFEQPTHAPVSSGGNRPWVRRLEYKSGKVPEGFAKQAVPEQAGAGFSYYDKESAQTVRRDSFTFFVVACLSGISGVTKDGDRYQNYYSSLVYDTRTQPLSVWMQGIERPIETGFYAELKPKMPQGVGFKQVLICYDMDSKELIALTLTVGLAMQIQRAIGAACNTPASKISLFSLCDISSEFWGIRFEGKFEKKTKDGEPWNGKGEMFFQPELKTGVISAAKNTALVEELNQYAEAVKEYVEATVQRVKQNEATHAPAPQPAETERTAHAAPAGRPPSNARPASVPASDPGFPDTPPPGDDSDLPF